MERPTLDRILTSDKLSGFNWILSIIDKDVFYSSQELKQELLNDKTRIDNVPIIPVDSNSFLFSGINIDIDDKLDFEISKLEFLSDDEIIDCVILGIGLSEEENDFSSGFTITPATIELESPFIEQPIFKELDVTSAIITEPKPTSPPRGYIPFINRKRGTTSPGGQWVWDGRSWQK